MPGKPRGACLGAPGLVLPVGLARGLPVGVELEGLPGGDRELLALGAALEGVLGSVPPPTIVQVPRRDRDGSTQRL